jgi:hypothetical protein
MKDNLNGEPTDRSPYQTGAAQGDAPGGGLANEQKRWLIDTGAGSVSAISERNAEHFVTHPTGGTARGVNGAPMDIVTGVKMVFKIATDDPAYPGGERNVFCDLPVAVTPDSDIIGMDQLAHVHVKVNWDPETKTGRLYETYRPRPEE